MRTFFLQFGDKPGAFGRVWANMAQCRAKRHRTPMRSVRTFRPALEASQSLLEARNLLSVAVPLTSGTAPTILSASEILSGPPPIGKNVHKKPVDEGFLIQFNEALDPTSAGNTGNYTVLTNSKHGKTTTTTPVAIRSVEYQAPGFNGGFGTVAIRTSKQKFAHGGELEVNGAPPSGIANSTDTLFLTGNTTFTISPKGRISIQPS
jgi:hypothetical protein